LLIQMPVRPVKARKGPLAFRAAGAVVTAGAGVAATGLGASEAAAGGVLLESGSGLSSRGGSAAGVFFMENRLHDTEKATTSNRSMIFN
jgi:hypothetical protein